MELQTKITRALTHNERDIFDLALQLATHADPKIDFNYYNGMMDEWATALAAEIQPEDEAVTKVARLNKFFFADLGFNSNSDDFYDPANSMLNRVIEQRSGIPISLSILFIKLGRMIGLDLDGVSFPGHFLVRVNVSEGGGILVLDTYHGGVSLDEEQLMRLLKHTQPEANEQLLAAYLQSASEEEVVMRLARNLKAIYINMKKYDDALMILNLMISLDDELINERRDRGMTLHHLDCNHSALPDLEFYAAARPKADDINEVRLLIMKIHKEMKPLH